MPSHAGRSPHEHRFEVFAWQAGQVDSSKVPDLVVKGITLSRYTHTINALLVAALFWMGAISFKKVDPLQSRLMQHGPAETVALQAAGGCMQVLKAEDEQLAFAFQVGPCLVSKWLPTEGGRIRPCTCMAQQHGHLHHLGCGGTSLPCTRRLVGCGRLVAVVSTHTMHGSLCGD